MLYLHYHTHLAARHVAKFHKLLSLAPKFLWLIRNISSQFLTPFEKNCKGNPHPCWGFVSKTWSFCTVCKNLGAQHPLETKIWSSDKGALHGYNFTSRSPRLMDQSLPDLFRLMLKKLR